MSYTTIEKLDEIINKKVLFIDLETTGFVENVDKNKKLENRYPDYKENKNYDSSRIVQIGYIVFDDYDYEIGIKNIKSVIIKPEEFVIPDDSIKIHGITNNIANEKGIKIKEGLKKLKKIIMKVEYIIGYNIYFDINILLNELNRAGLKKPIKKIKELIKEERIICIGELSRQYKCYKNMPSQKQIYKELFEKPIENIHNAQYDILATIEIISWYKENKEKFIEKIEKNIEINIKKVINENFFDEIDDKNTNYGLKWEKDEYVLLMEEIKKNICIDEICKNHKRNLGGIKGGIKRLMTQNPTDKFIKKYYDNIQNKKVNNDNNDDIVDNNDNNDNKNINEIINDCNDDENINDKNVGNIKEIYPNIGKKWSNKEYFLLEKEINENKSLDEICKNHGRYKGGIRKAIKRMIDDKKLKYSDKLRKHYSIKFNQNIKENNSESDENDDNAENNENKSYEKIILKLIEKIENLKNKNQALTNEINILKNEKKEIEV
jgi:hypothetical protein